MLYRQFKLSPKCIATLIVLGAVLFLTACAPSDSPDAYGNRAAGTSATVKQGTILEIRTVKLSGETGVATPVGAIAGGVAGSYIGGDTRMNILGGLGGAVLGGVAGHYVDKGLTSRDGLQYIIKLTDGRTISVVQGKTPPLRKGQKVLVMFDNHGKKVRVIADDTHQNLSPKPAKKAPTTKTSKTTKTVTTTDDPKTNTSKTTTTTVTTTMEK